MPAAPRFWSAPPGLAANLLWPIGLAWDAGGRLRRAVARPYRAPVPVVCVGNLVAGGAGKTPVAMALADWLVARGVRAHIVTRGYGGRLCGPLRVDPTRHDAAAVGDEALLLALHAPCWIARDRAAGVAAACAAGAGMILLDDGFQNPTVAKSLGLIVIDGAYGLGNGRVMPAGPLREAARSALTRADAVIVLTPEGGVASLVSLPPTLPVVPAVLAPVEGGRFAGRRVVAFAGIGRPQKFFATLRALGAVPVLERGFADHHPFGAREIAELRRTAGAQQALLVTTQKDFVRLPAGLRDGIDVLEVVVRWPEPSALERVLAPMIRP